MDLIEIDVIRLQSAKAGINSFDDVLSRGTDVVVSWSHSAVAFGGNDYVLALNTEVAKRLSENLFAGTVGIDVGGVEEIDAFIYTSFNQLVGFILFGATNHFENASTAKSHGANAYRRNQ